MAEHNDPHRRSPGESYPGPQPEQPEQDPYEHGEPGEDEPARRNDDAAAD